MQRVSSSLTKVSQSINSVVEVFTSFDNIAEIKLLPLPRVSLIPGHGTCGLEHVT